MQFINKAVAGYGNPAPGNTSKLKQVNVSGPKLTLDKCPDKMSMKLGAFVEEW